MDAIVLQKIRGDFPNFRFEAGGKFKFRPPRTIVFDTSLEGRTGLILMMHELGHAILGHRNFKTEIGRLKMEVMAWEKARELALKYEVKFDEKLMERELDSYREWLHQKSRCPICGLTRFQTPDALWHCPYCDM